MARFTLKTFVKLFILTYIIVFIYSLTNFKARVRFSQPDFIFEDSNYFMIANHTAKCKLKKSELHSVVLNISQDITLKDIANANPELKAGGSWQPKDCDSWQNVAILIPYRDRPYHLRVLLNRLHPMLQKQKIAYQIFIVEQIGKAPFNKGRLYNAAFLEASNIYDFDCFIMHDADLLPETDKNIYMCDSHARHLSSAIDEQRYHPIYNNIFGGVIALSKSNYLKVNGFPNRYVGWGNEDDDVSARTYGAGLLLTRPPYHIGRYKMLRHLKSDRTAKAYLNFYQWRYWWKIDGLSNMKDINYKVLSVTKNELFTNISVDVGAVPPPPREDIPQEHWLWFLWFFAP